MGAEGSGCRWCSQSCVSVADTWHRLEPGQEEKGDRMGVTTVWHADDRERFGRFVVQRKRGPSWPATECPVGILFLF